RGGYGRARRRVYSDRNAIGRIELVQFDQNHATRLGAWSVTGRRRVADVAADRIVAVLVLEYAFEHQELFAAIVCMRRERTAWRVTNDRSSASHLSADPVQHTT